jgi:hypothetical protein
MPSPELSALLDRATRIFVSSEDGEDRESMACYWVGVVEAAAESTANLSSFLDSWEAEQANIAAEQAAHDADYHLDLSTDFASTVESLRNMWCEMGLDTPDALTDADVVELDDRASTQASKHISERAAQLVYLEVVKRGLANPTDKSAW